MPEFLTDNDIFLKIAKCSLYTNIHKSFEIKYSNQKICEKLKLKSVGQVLRFVYIL